ncbi:TnsD family Tn7-like transposition protein [Anoxybacillus ayderensis]|uniref:TnsD family Tn7-like transposition protein n=2 Tax=Anoxybacillus ayderensis TaxID=265546 RepID=UPI002E1ADC65|nr:TnsD family Tn7-like transposition protein [Anoxybacillus ayderensis]
MLNFFPMLYKDELLFSGIARYKQMCGMISNQALSRDLFGYCMTYSSALFGYHLNAFVSNLPPSCQLTVDELIWNHTMFPFFTAFLSPSKTSEVYKLIAEKGKTFVENVVGISSGSVKTGSYLKYCPVCFSEDMKTIGESYWRRIHQIPGALYCIKHEVVLKTSNVLSVDSRFRYICADREVCSGEMEEDLYSTEIKKQNLQYIRNAQNLMKIRERKEREFIISFYLDQLREKGLASKNGTIYMRKLQDAFLDFYSTDYLELMQSTIEREKMSNWLRLFVRYRGKNRSPVRHLLFLQFLDLDVSDLYLCQEVIGKRTKRKSKKQPISLILLEQKRKQWLEIIGKHPHATRSELKKIGKGLYTWLYTHDKEWHDRVTPKKVSVSARQRMINWQEKDEQWLQLAQEAVQQLLRQEGKPIRITPSSIRRQLGAKGSFLNKKLVKTNAFLKEITEDIESFRIRKIKWAIKELMNKNKKITPYKVQLYAGFGGKSTLRPLIEKILREDGHIDEGEKFCLHFLFM